MTDFSKAAIVGWGCMAGDEKCEFCSKPTSAYIQFRRGHDMVPVCKEHADRAAIDEVGEKLQEVFAPKKNEPKILGYIIETQEGEYIAIDTASMNYYQIDVMARVEIYKTYDEAGAVMDRLHQYEYQKFGRCKIKKLTVQDA